MIYLVIVTCLLVILTLMALNKYSSIRSLFNLLFILLFSIIFFQYYCKNSFRVQIDFIIVFWPLFIDTLFIIFMIMQIVQCLFKIKEFFQNLEAFCFISSKIFQIIFMISLHCYIGVILLNCVLDLSLYK